MLFVFNRFDYRTSSTFTGFNTIIGLLIACDKLDINIFSTGSSSWNDFQFAGVQRKHTHFFNTKPRAKLSRKVSTQWLYAKPIVPEVMCLATECCVLSNFHKNLFSFKRRTMSEKINTSHNNLLPSADEV